MAASAQITLYELMTLDASLEEAYMSLTEDSIDFRSQADRDLRRAEVAA